VPVTPREVSGEEEPSDKGNALRALVRGLHKWLALVPEDFLQNKDLLMRANFLMEEAGYESAAVVSAAEQGAAWREKESVGSFPPTPYLPVNLHGGLSSLSLSMLNPIEIARQLTVQAYDLFVVIGPREWLENVQNHRERAPNIQQFVDNFNHLSSLTATSILKADSLEERLNALRLIIQVARECHRLQNIHSLVAILCALEATPISRLKLTWKALEKRDKECIRAYHDMQEVVQVKDNFGALRGMYKEYSGKPFLPYVGIVLSDLTFIIDGNRNVPVPLNHTNVPMYEMIANTLYPLRVMQITPYHLEKIKFIQNLISAYPTLSTNQQYSRSLQIEAGGSKPAGRVKETGASKDVGRIAEGKIFEGELGSVREKATRGRRRGSIA